MAPIQPRRSDISSDTESQQSFTPTAPSSISGRLRVDVRIGNGDKIVVPITDVTTFGELQEQAIARAKRMNVKIEKGDLALRLENRNGPLAFPDDTITDLLDVSDRSEIFLCSASMEEVSSFLVRIAITTKENSLAPRAILTRYTFAG